MYNDSFRIRYKRAPVAISENSSGADTAAHIHAEIEILYIVSGRWQVTVSDRRYDAAEGDMIIVNPFDVHSLRRVSDNPARTLCICIDPCLLIDRELSDMLRRGERSAGEYFAANDRITPLIYGYFQRIYSAVENDSETLCLESGAYLSLIFSELARGGALITRSQRGKRESFSAKIQEYLADHYSESITSDDAAEALFYSQSYFCRLFKKQFGTSFLEYLSMYRISRAKTMLETTHQRVAEVAEAVGFMDNAYFSRCFKRLVGFSPSEYKKINTVNEKSQYSPNLVD